MKGIPYTKELEQYLQIDLNKKLEKFLNQFNCLNIKCTDDGQKVHYDLCKLLASLTEESESEESATAIRKIEGLKKEQESPTDIRNISERIRLTSSCGKFKVYLKVNYYKKNFTIYTGTKDKSFIFNNTTNDTRPMLDLIKEAQTIAFEKLNLKQ